MASTFILPLSLPFNSSFLPRSHVVLSSLSFLSLFLVCELVFSFSGFRTQHCRNIASTAGCLLPFVSSQQQGVLFFLLSFLYGLLECSGRVTLGSVFVHQNCCMKSSLKVAVVKKASKRSCSPLFLLLFIFSLCVLLLYVHYVQDDDE